ncbi:MAG: hypothetical protein H5U39_03380 [Deferribacterales bacterium]|nr:hypothetical protein [Deferribacterales bacterium]
MKVKSKVIKSLNLIGKKLWEEGQYIKPSKNIDNPLVVISELAKNIYEKYGDEALFLFGPILKQYGFNSGLKIKQKVEKATFADRVKAWLEEGLKSGQSQIVEVGDSYIIIKGYQCPLRLENSGRILCEVLMNIDVGIVSALAGKDINIKINKTLAQGDEYCLVTFYINSSF